MPADSTQVAIPLAEFFERRRYGTSNKEVWIAVRPMTEKEGNQAYPYRPKSKYSESYFGGNELSDDTSLLLNGSAIRCKMCKVPTRVRFLEDGSCPDCDGRSEYNGTNPHQA